MKKTSVLLNTAALDEYKTDLLLSGSCAGVFRASAIRKSTGCYLLYDTAGYKSLAGLRALNASAALSLTEKVLRLAEKCEDHLLMLGEYVLSPDTLFINENAKDMKLLYVPCVSTEKSDSYVLSRFVRQTKCATSENGGVYLDTLMRFLLRDNPDTERIIAFIEKLKQEIYECGIR